jgi:HSP20 family protein
MYSRRFSPFEELEAIREQINQAFEPVVRTVVQEASAAAGALTIPLELVETPNEYKLRASLPGVDPEKIDVQATGKSLSISAEVNAPEYAKDEFVHLKELRVGKVRRTLEFDEAILTDRIQATYQHGILQLTIPKLEGKREQSIKVEIKS